MARRLEDGLKYFSFDTDFFYSDRRIKSLRIKYGFTGLMFYIYLLTEIYRNGYYVRWDEDAKESAIDLGFTEGFIEQVVKFLIGRSLITEIKLTDKDTFLSAPGIQKRYQDAMRSVRRDVRVNKDLWLLGEDETASFIKFAGNEDKYGINSDKYGINSDKYSINSTNKTKQNKTKLNKTKQKETMITLMSPSFSDFVKESLKEWLDARLKLSFYAPEDFEFLCYSIERRIEREGEPIVNACIRASIGKEHVYWRDEDV